MSSRTASLLPLPTFARKKRSVLSGKLGEPVSSSSVAADKRIDQANRLSQAVRRFQGGCLIKKRRMQIFDPDAHRHAPGNCALTSAAKRPGRFHYITG